MAQLCLSTILRVGSHKNLAAWGTDRFTGLELIEETLNLKTPTVYDYVDKKPVVNAQSTEAAREKQERIKEKFMEEPFSHKMFTYFGY